MIADKSTRQLVILVAAWIAFFIVEVLWHNEIALTAVAILTSALLFMEYESGEVHLYAFGVALGLVIEVGLGQIARLQHWENASLFGIPYWLPLIWGFGFVAIRRIGNIIVAYFAKV
jgi:hypothetical protein